MKSKEDKKIWVKLTALLCTLMFSSYLLFSVQVFADLPLKEGGFASPTVKKTREYVPGEIIVKFKDVATEGQIKSINSMYETSVLYTSPYAGFKRVKIPPDKTMPEMVKLYRKNPLVEYAEPNYIDHACWIPNDPYYSYQWHFPQINMPSAWDIEQGGDSSVVVAVLDSGVAYEDYGSYQQAPDLAGTNFVSGYDFVNNDSHPNDDDGHGTHVTGTIAQTTNNGLGVAGIAFNCSIMPVKVLDAEGSGTHQQIADGIYYAVDHGAEVINLSIGGPSSTTEHNAVKYAYDHGVIIVAATGNENESSILYPAAYDECIAVGAVRYDKARAPYSNYGDGIELMAPGGDTSVDQNGDGYGDGVLQQTFSGGDPTNFAYWFWQGTSMATPHVTGVVALMLSHGVSGIGDIRDILHSTAEDLGDPGYDNEYGYGLVDVAAALSYTGYPDLTITEITSTPSPSVSGEEVQVTIEFANQGDADAGGFYIDLYKDRDTAPSSGDTGDKFTEISGLAAGATSSTTFTYTYNSLGTKKIWAQIDTDNFVEESNENNNIYGPYYHNVTEPLPDLTIRSISSNPNPSLSGEGAQVTVEFTNQGSAGAGSFWLDLYKDRDTAPSSGDTGDKFTEISGLAAGTISSTTFTCTYNAIGTKKIWAQIDTDDQVSESNEENNVYGPYDHEVLTLEVGGIISTDTTWVKFDSPYIGVDDVKVAPDATLTIESGVTVKMKNSYKIWIKGALMAEGGENNRITFKPNGTNTWGGIYFDEDSSGTVKYCDIKEANKGIHIKSSSPTISNNQIVDNQNYGIYVQGPYSSPTISENEIVRNPTGVKLSWIWGTVSFTNNTISDGSIGLEISTSNANVQTNTFSSNSICGILIYGKWQGVLNIEDNKINSNRVGIKVGDPGITSLTHNNIFDSSEYALKNSTSENISASGNWWGTTDTSRIDELIYDMYDDFEKGEVNYTPILTSPYPEPSSINLVSLKSDETYSSDLTGPVKVGDTLYIQLEATDPDPLMQDITTVTISSTATDPTGITIILTEATQDTGVYRGTAKVKSTSDDDNDEIGANPEGDVITVTSDVDSSKQCTVNVVDTNPPEEVVDFVASQGSNNGEINLSWTNPTDADFAGVRIQRKVGSAPSDEADGTTAYDGTGENFTDTSLDENTTYYYKAFTYDEVPNYSSGQAPSPDHLKPKDTNPPANVTGFSATAGNAQVSLSWTNPSDIDWQGTKVLRKTGSYPVSPTNGTEVYDGTGSSFTDTGLTNGTTYYYTAFAYDEVPNYSSAATSAQDSATPEDTEPPSITHTQVTSTSKGEDLLILAAISDDSAVSSATVHYRQGGKVTYTSAAMSPGSNYQGTIPGSYVTERGLEYYIQAEDIYGNVATLPETNPSASPYTVRVNFSSLSFPFSTLQKKWQMISVPADLDNPGPGSVLVDDLGEQDNTVWKLYHWDTENEEYDEYPSVPNFTPGKAFWIITKNQKNIDVEAGTSVDTSSDYAIDLASGWTQIGPPFCFDVDWDDVKVRKDSEVVSIQEAQDNGWVRDKIWYWDGSEYVFYQAPDGTLEPWKGYWAKALISGCELLIPPVETEESTTTLRRTLTKSKENYLQIIAKTGNLKDSYNFIGLSDEAKDSYDAKDVEEAPPIPPYISLSFPHQDWGKDSALYTQDIRKTSYEDKSSPEKISWNVQVRTDQKNKKVTLEWERTEAIPQQYNLYLTGQNVLVDMREENTYSFITPTGKEHFKVVATTEELSPSPEDLTLTEVYNYPNPVDNATNIHFKLGADANVTVRVYTISGELVRTLVENKAYSFGSHDGETEPELQWSLTNNRGSSCARGVYILLVEAKNSAKRLIETNKIAVIK